MKKIKIFGIILALAICLSLNQMASAKILFKDNFEEEQMGKEPSKWEYDPGAEVTDRAEIIKDPIEGDKCMSHFGGYVVNGSKEWKNYVVEFDWMYTHAASNESVAFRYQDANKFYQLSKRGDMQSIKIYMYNGSWNDIGTGTFPVVLDTWYRFQLKVEGSAFTVKIKEKKSQTPFSNIKPTLEVKDKTYDKGGFSTAYYGPIDDVVIAETEADILAVEPASKLSTMWGALKL